MSIYNRASISRLQQQLQQEQRDTKLIATTLMHVNDAVTANSHAIERVKKDVLSMGVAMSTQ